MFTPMGPMPSFSPSGPPDPWIPGPADFAPPPPEPVDTPDIPTPEFVEEATEWLSDWAAASYAYVQKKTPEWELHTRMLQNRLYLRELAFRKLTDDMTEEEAAKKADHLTDFVYPIFPAANAWASSAYQAIMRGPDPFIIEDLEGTGDIQTPQKIQKMLREGLDAGKFKTFLWSALLRLGPLGSQYAKVFWHEETIKVRRQDPYSGQIVEEPKTVRACPIIQPVALDKMLVDWNAKHMDIQRWSGIGHRVLKTFTEVIDGFRKGRYSLGLNEVLEKWAEAKNSVTPREDELDRDDDALNLPDGSLENWLELWEIHARVPSKSMGRAVECVAVFACDQKAVSPENGVLIKLTTRPVLWCGLRPFVGAGWKNEPPGPFSQPMPEHTRDIHLLISNQIAQVQDISRQMAGPMWWTRASSLAADQINENPSMYPGRIFTSETPNDITAIGTGSANTAPIMQALQMIMELYEKESSATDTYLGVRGGRQTATEAQILQQQSAMPNETVLELFVANYVEPALNLALELYKQFSTDDRVVLLKGDRPDSPQRTILTATELQGRYRVLVTLTNQDSTRIAKVQAMQQVMPVLPNFIMLLQQSGWSFDAGQFMLRFLDLLGIDGADRMLTRLPPPPPPNPWEDPSQMGGPPMSPGDPSLPPGGMMSQGTPPGMPPASPPSPQGAAPGGGGMPDMNQMARILQMQAAMNSRR